MVTLKEIAQHCGVSVTTVSNIVNNSPKKVRDETRKKVMEAIEGTWVSSKLLRAGAAQTAHSDNWCYH